MNFGILINEGPYNHQAVDSAYQFAKAVIEKGHKVSRVFFYYDGVNNANKLLEAPRDERQIGERWAAMAKDHGVDLVVCVAAGLRRGLKDEVLAEGFRISGLGQLIEVGVQADRMVTFGD